MLFIHKTNCISPQQTPGNHLPEIFAGPVEGIYRACEPQYDEIPPGLLRRMGKAVRLGIGACLPLIRNEEKLGGIIIGTANGGMEDCIRFLNQIIEYNEGQLTPGNFVQSTPNAIAATIGMMTKNRGYNITHVHRGHSFETALLDALMMSTENPEDRYVVGAVDEISDYNYNIEMLGGWYKNHWNDSHSLYQQSSAGSLAGEGSAMFIVSGQKKDAIGIVEEILVLNNPGRTEIKNVIDSLCSQSPIDLLLSGENGDNRLDHYYRDVESNFINVAQFKHLCGEFPTAVAFGLWLSVLLLGMDKIPDYLMKNKTSCAPVSRILIYNTYKGAQHSFIVVRRH